MITQLEVFSPQPDAPELRVGGFMPNDDPVQVKNIDGLGPVKADITSTQSATGRGEIPQGTNTGKRNIVLTLGFNPDFAGNETMSGLRQALYRYLIPEQWTKLRFHSDDLPTVDIEGTVESVEPNMFSQDPEVQVSVICLKPDFVASDATIITGVSGTPTPIDYPGTVDTGFELRVDNDAYSGSLDITVVAWEVPQVFSIDPVTIDDTKYFGLSTIQSKKRVQTVVIVGEATTNLLSAMSAGSVWPVLKPGANVFTLEAEAVVDWTFAYFTRFGGL